MAVPLTPEEIQVSWQAPRKWNGPPINVTYIVHFSTLTKQGPFTRQTGNFIPEKMPDGSNFTVLTGLEQNHVYEIKV